VVNYIKGVQTTDRKPGSMVVKEEFVDYSKRSKRSSSPGDPMNASHSTTTFSYYTGYHAGERG